MPHWLRKTLIVFITVATFGLVTPPAHLYMDADAAHSKKSTSVEGRNAEASSQIEAVVQLDRDTEPLENEEEPEDDPKSWHEIAATVTADDIKPVFTEYATEHASKQAIQKFGPAIEDEIGDEFQSKILPKMEEVIQSYADQWDQEQLLNLALSERPTGGVGEKIFHLYDTRSGEDLVRFHVRRDNPPKEGYWFNFHYHDAKDQFAEHHDLGKIYWDKNTPPHWMS